ncbi:uncharacterized protein cubi_00977 [Cryptosporidium ubiquitum]|uniref:Uncharacterized protein n=1 Tax=Cryptosporidium ubiquitum TaxID=857276 RepID=A0A1J4M9D7_9CRYT|nr:uncharacterized protein cubi_00977 [Cryptosporidium ubiquitum]OII70832.1 hypothetical protein cubi_00977 [Cryptosporidium ubiquitum]
MTCNLIFFLFILICNIFIFKESNFYLEVGFIKIKAVGGDDSSQYDSSVSTNNGEDLSDDENNNEYDENSATSSNRKSSVSLEPGNNSVYISKGNAYFEKCIGNVCIFSSFNDSVKFLLFEAKIRELDLSLLECQKIVHFYLKSKFTPKTAVKNELVINIKDLINLMIKYVRTEGRCLLRVYQKESSKKSRDSSRSTNKVHDKSDSDTDSSLESDPKTNFGAAPSIAIGPVGSKIYYLLRNFSEGSSKASNKSSKGHVSEGPSASIPLGKDVISSTQRDDISSRDSSQASVPVSNLDQELEFEESPEMEIEEDQEHITPQQGEDYNIEYEDEGMESQVNQEMIVKNLDLNTRSAIPLKEIEMEIDLEDPWRNLITMLLYEPVRRSSLVYREEHCKKIVKTTGRIIAFLVKASCKLRLSLSDYNRKKCREKNKVSGLLTGCHKLRTNIKKYLNLYSKFRYDLVDSVVAITQCSIAKNNYLSQTDQIILNDSEDSLTIQCTLKEYYFSIDFHIFLSFIINAYNSAKEKLEQFISSGCESTCLTRCGKKPRLCSCLEHSFNNIFADKINMESYNFYLNKRISMCKDYLVRNYLYSNNIPESAEYISTSGNRYKLEQFDYIQLVQFPRVYPFNLKKLSIIKSNIYELLLNHINTREQPTQLPVAKENSTSGTSKQKQKSKSKFNLKLMRKNGKKGTNENNNVHPSVPQANSQDSWT